MPAADRKHPAIEGCTPLAGDFAKGFVGRDWIMPENRRTRYPTDIRQITCAERKSATGAPIFSYRTSGLNADHAFQLLSLYASMRGETYKESGASLPREFIEGDLSNDNSFSFRGIDLTPEEKSRLVLLDVELEQAR